MTKRLCLFTLLAGLALQDAQADDRVLSQSVIYYCQGSRAVGYKNGSWTPTIFDDGPKFKIEEQKWASGRRYWTVRIMYKDWTYVGANNRNDIEIFQTDGGPVGTYFVLNEDTGRFSFMDAFGYMANDQSATAHMSIGACHATTPLGRAKSG